LKVLRTIPMFFPVVTGPGKQAFEVSLQLEKRGVSSPVVTSDFEVRSIPKNEIVQGVSISRLRSFGGVMQYRIVPSIFTRLLKEDFDILHAHNYRNMLTDCGFITSRIKSKPFILQPHGGLVGYKKFVSGFFGIPYRVHDLVTLKSVARKADTVIVSTIQEYREAVEFGVEESKISVIPAGINLGLYDKVPCKKSPNKRILFVGRISRDRNLEQILYAFKEVVKEVKDSELVIIGDEVKRSFASYRGYMLELKNLANDLHIHDYVKFVGPIYGEDLIKVYKSSHVFVYTSKYENFGQTILEAAASRLPIISTPVGVARDIIEDSTAGYLVGFNPKELSDKLISLLNDEKKIKDFGENARKIAENYSWEIIIERYIELYDKLLEEK